MNVRFVRSSKPVELNRFILEQSSNAPDENVAANLATPVHADSNATAFQGPDQDYIRELRSLFGSEDRRFRLSKRPF